MAENEPLSGKFIAHAIAAWVIFFALYLLFAGTGEPAELAAGGISAGLAAAFEAALRVRNERALDLSLRMLWPLLPALGQLVLDTFRVAGGLLPGFRVPPAGEFRTIPLPAGSMPDAPAGLAIAVAAASLTPNAFVVEARPQASRIVVHQLVG